MNEIILYDHHLSGNCLKVRMFMTILGLSFRTEFIDVLSKKNHEEWFISLNPHRQIPVIQDGETIVQDSQAILTYLAIKYNSEWFGKNAEENGSVMEWLSFAAKEVSNGPQMARLHQLVPDEDIDGPRATALTVKVLAFLQEVLTDRDWLTLGRPTIADIAVFPYVGLVHEAKLDLANYPAVESWILRISKLPGYVPMRGLPGYIGDDGYCKKELVS